VDRRRAQRFGRLDPLEAPLEADSPRQVRERVRGALYLAVRGFHGVREQAVLDVRTILEVGVTEGGGQCVASHGLHRAQPGMQLRDGAACALLLLRTLPALEADRLDCPQLNQSRAALDREAAVRIDVEIGHRRCHGRQPEAIRQARVPHSLGALTG
jgi:hypothetical protein